MPAIEESVSMPLCAKSRANIGLNIRPREILCGYLCMLLLRERMERNLQAVFLPDSFVAACDEMLTETFSDGKRA